MKTIRIHSRNSLTLLAVLCVAIFGVAVLGACSGPWNSDTGIIRINLGGGARSVEVTDEMKAAMVYDISLTGSGGEIIKTEKLENGVAAASFTVAPGVYEITVHAYLNADDRENENLKPFATGNGSVSVTAGKTSDAKITMRQAENPPPVVETYTITLTLNGGSYDGNSDDKYRIEEVPSGSLLSEHIDNDKLTREGYTFGGWYGDENFENEAVNLTTTTVTSDTTLYAKWKPITTEPPVLFTVSFNSNSGSDVASQEVTRDGKARRPDDPTREGYSFAGWYRDQELITEYDFDTPVTSSITLYAKWTPVPPGSFTVTFNSDGGTHIPGQVVESGRTAARPDDPTKEGFTFAGWYRDQELTAEYDFDTPVTGNITLYAKWTPITPDPPDEGIDVEIDWGGIVEGGKS